MLATPVGLYELSDIHLDVDEFGVHIDNPVVLLGTRHGSASRHKQGSKSVIKLGSVHYPESIFRNDGCNALDNANDMLYGAVVVSEDDLTDDAITALRKSGGSVFSDVSDPNVLY